MTIEKHHVVAFGRNLMHAPQATQATLVSCVESDISYGEPGTSYTDPLLGKSNPKLITDRFGETPTEAIARAQRGGFFYSYEDAKYLDKIDQARQLVDPANPVVEAMARGVRRSRDDFIIGVALGSVREGQSLENTVAWGGTVIAAAATGLTVTKLRSAMNALDEGEVEGERYFVGGNADKQNLLAATEVTSSDYNTVKALVNGQIDEFLGFKFRWFKNNRILLSGAERRCFGFVKPALVYKARAIVGGENARITERDDRKFNWQAYLSFEQAGHRRYDEGVVEVRCA